MESAIEFEIIQRVGVTLSANCFIFQANTGMLGMIQK